MRTFKLQKSFQPGFNETEKTTQLMRMFGLSKDSLAATAINHRCRVTVRPGDVVYITGPSGSGKSVLLGEFRRAIEPSLRISLERIALEKDKAVIDCIDADLTGALKFLSTAGLGDVYCMLQSPSKLSAGQQYRYRLAQALAIGRPYILADEFCSCLDDITAAVISYKIRRFASSHKVTFILAGTSRVMLADLQPDVIVEKDFRGQADVIYKDARRQEAS